jgi:hypothetical protein
VVPSWLALYWIAQGSRFESQRGHLFFGISLWGEISQVLEIDTLEDSKVRAAKKCWLGYI